MDEHVEEQGVILFYKYIELKDPEEVATWFRTIMNELKIIGKVRVAYEGINGTMGGTLSMLNELTRMCESTSFMDGQTSLADIDFKFSPSDPSFLPFIHTSVRVVNEIITMDAPQELSSIHNTATHIPPEEFHHILESRSKENKENELVVIDCRNEYEHKIGRFQGHFTTITPNLRKFSQWPEWVDEHIDELENCEVLMYCTGGIRCERGSAYLRSKGALDVKQLLGGIHRYIEKYPDGYFRGKNFVFDERGFVKANDDILSSCEICGTSFDKYQECSSKDCKAYVLACDPCREERGGKVFCCEKCQQYGPKWTKLNKKIKTQPKRNKSVLSKKIEQKKRNRVHIDDGMKEKEGIGLIENLDEFADSMVGLFST